MIAHLQLQLQLAYGNTFIEAKSVTKVGK